MLMLVAGFDPNQITVDLLPSGPRDIYFFFSKNNKLRKHLFDFTRSDFLFSSFWG